MRKRIGLLALALALSGGAALAADNPGGPAANSGQPAPEASPNQAAAIPAPAIPGGIVAIPNPNPPNRDSGGWEEPAYVPEIPAN